MKKLTKKNMAEKKAQRVLKKESSRKILRGQFDSFSDEQLSRFYNTMTIAGYSLSTFHSCIDAMSGDVLLIEKIDKMRESLLYAQESFYNEARLVGRELEKNQTQRWFDMMFTKMAYVSKEQMQDIIDFFDKLDVSEGMSHSII